MGTPTYTAIASTTLTSSASSVTFSSLDTIAAGYRDLVLVVNAAKNDAGGDALRMQFNADTGSNYSTVFMEGDGSSTFSNTYTGTAIWDVYWNAIWAGATKAQATFHVMDFASTDKHKSTLSRSGRADKATVAAAGRWANTAAITSITLSYTNPSATFSIGSTFSLYGIVA